MSEKTYLKDMKTKAKNEIDNGSRVMRIPPE